MYPCRFRIKSLQNLLSCVSLLGCLLSERKIIRGVGYQKKRIKERFPIFPLPVFSNAKMFTATSDPTAEGQSSGSRPTQSCPPGPSVKPPSQRGLASVARLVKLGRCKNVVVVAGAGISTASGIPDFRCVSGDMCPLNSTAFFQGNPDFCLYSVEYKSKSRHCVHQGFPNFFMSRKTLLIDCRAFEIKRIHQKVNFFRTYSSLSGVPIIVEGIVYIYMRSWVRVHVYKVISVTFYWEKHSLQER